MFCFPTAALQPAEPYHPSFSTHAEAESLARNKNKSLCNLLQIAPLFGQQQQFKVIVDNTLFPQKGAVF